MSESVQLWMMFIINVIVIVSAVIKSVTVLLAVRDEIRALQVAIIGSKETGSGMIGDILQLQKEYWRMRDWMINASAALHIDPPSRS